jgi:HPt (histidine-containing phosphotransfer) domain-containing protein
MVELVVSFLNEMPARITAIDQAMSSGHAPDLRRLAHQMKGAAGGYGFPTITAAAGKIENAIVAMKDPAMELARVDREVRELVQLCHRAIQGKPKS